jgi:chromate transporter
VSLLAYVYYRYQNLEMVQAVLGGLRPAVVAMIASAGISILLLALLGEGGKLVSMQDLNLISVFLFVIGLVLLRCFKPNPILIMAGAGALGILFYDGLGLTGRITI